MPDSCLCRVLVGVQRLEFIGLADNPCSRSNYEEFRAVFIGALPRLRALPSTLKWMDERRITGSEVADAWLRSLDRKDRVGRHEAECFRFASLYWERYGHARPETLTVVDLTHGGLRAADLRRFRSARRMLLDHNAFSVSGLTAAGLFELPDLDEVSLTFNRFSKLESLALIATKLPATMRVFNCMSCKAYEADTPDMRYARAAAAASSHRLPFDAQPIVC
jgi:hypothetical protein